jgi:hypothetical protein
MKTPPITSHSMSLKATRREARNFPMRKRADRERCDSSSNDATPPALDRIAATA